MGVLPDRGLRREEGLQRLAIFPGRILPIGADRIPTVAQAFFVSVAVLRNDRRDPLRMLYCQSEAGRCAVIENIDGIAIKADDFGETVDDRSDPIEAVAAVGPVGVPEAGQVRRNDVEAIGQERNEIAEHMAGAREAVQQQELRGT